MSNNLIVLIIEAFSVYLLVLWVHSLRDRFGLGPFYALLGGITAVMSWVTDAGVQVQAAGITFVVGSTVFYTALLLGVFVVYVFDGPRSTRIAILTIAGVSIFVPLIAVILHFQMQISGLPPLGYVPIPSLRINTASVLATVADLIFLAIAWEFLGKPELQMKTWVRAFLTLLGVMWLDVVLFATGAFLGTPDYFSILQGTLLSRLVISAFAAPFLFVYINWQSHKPGVKIENRPLFAILKEVTEVRAELGYAQQEIELRKQVEAALRESEQRYNAFINTHSDMIFLKDEQFRYLIVNDKLSEFYGKPIREILNKTDDELVDRVHAERCRETDMAALASDVPVISEEIIGETIFETTKFSTQLRNNQIGIGGIIHDVTERRRTEAALRESEEKYRLLAERTEIILWEYDILQDRWTYVSPQSERILGYAPEEWTDFRFWRQCLHPEDLKWAPGYCSEHIERGQSHELEYRFISKDGRVVWLRDRANVELENGVTVKMRGLMMDITQQKQLEENLRLSLQEKKHLIQELYHRVKNNMQVISSMLMLQAGHLNDPRLHAAVQDTTNRIQAMALVHEKLYQSYNLSSLNLDEYISDLAGMLLKTYHVKPNKVTLTLDTKPVPALIDIAVPCGLVLNELISNALKYAFPEDQTGEIRVRLRREADATVELLVSDNGVGLPPGFDVRSSNTIGLQMAIAIVEHQLQGQISFNGHQGLTCRMQFKDDIYQERV